MQATSGRRVKASLAVLLASALAFGYISVRSPDRGSTEDVLLGEDLVSELGLVLHEKAPTAEMHSGEEGLVLDGVVLKDCAPSSADDVVIIQQVGDGSDFYCVHAPSEIEAWIIGQMLNERIPTEEEIKEMEFGLSD